VPPAAANLRPLPDLPTLFRPVALREAGDAMARAVALAPEHGAGTLTWVGAYARAEAAAVLEPEMPLGPARLAFMAASNALADALVALGPPECLVQLRWPGTLLLNHGACGQLRLAAPSGAAEDAVPDWLVVGMEARIAFPESHEPGRDPGVTSLLEEGFDPETTSAAEITAAWARHLMAGLDEWQARGPHLVAERYLTRLVDEADTSRGLDPATGDLVLEPPRRRWSLREALE
jgi:biotin-(acetyl-CoA carboxylase) ligase